MSQSDKNDASKKGPWHIEAGPEQGWGSNVAICYGPGGHYCIVSRWETPETRAEFEHIVALHNESLAAPSTEAATVAPELPGCTWPKCGCKTKCPPPADQDGARYRYLRKYGWDLLLPPGCEQESAVSPANLDELIDKAMARSDGKGRP